MLSVSISVKISCQIGLYLQSAALHKPFATFRTSIFSDGITKCCGFFSGPFPLIQVILSRKVSMYRSCARNNIKQVILLWVLLIRQSTRLIPLTGIGSLMRRLWRPWGANYRTPHKIWGVNSGNMAGSSRWGDDRPRELWDESWDNGSNVIRKKNSKWIFSPRIAPLSH